MLKKILIIAVLVIIIALAIGYGYYRSLQQNGDVATTEQKAEDDRVPDPPAVTGFISFWDQLTQDGKDCVIEIIGPDTTQVWVENDYSPKQAEWNSLIGCYYK